MLAKTIMVIFPLAVVATLGVVSTKAFFHTAPLKVDAHTALLEAPSEVIPEATEEKVAEVSQASAPSSASSSATSTEKAPIASSTEASSAASGIHATDARTPAPVKIAPRETSATLLSQSNLGAGWASNSWGIDSTLGSKSGLLMVTYEQPWAALSLYTTGFSLKEKNSIEIQIATPSTDPATLFVTLFNHKEKIGSVALTPYQVANLKQGYFRIPISDIGKTGIITDVVLESAIAQKISLTSIRFSRVHANSQLVATPAPVIVVPAPEIAPTPVVVAPVVTPPQAPVVLPDYATGPNIYRTGLQDNWKTVVRRGAVIDDLMNDEQSITGKAIKAHFDQQDGSLAFVHPRGIKTAGYQTLHMYIYGGVTDREWQQIIVSAYDENGNKLGSVDAMKFSGNGSIRMQTWNKSDIPLRELNASNAVIKSIDIENVAVTKTVEANDHMWFDDIRLLDDAGSY